MNTKVILATMAAFALAMSIVPTAAAGIPVPKGQVMDVANGASPTAAAIATGYADDLTEIGRQAEMANVKTAASIGEAIWHEGDGEIYVASAEALAITGALRDSTFLGANAGTAYGTRSVTTLAKATEFVGLGTQEALNAGIDGAASFGVQTQQAADRQVDLVGAGTQGASQDLGGVQRVLTQGSLATYNAHAAPAACIGAGIVANLSGAVSAQQSCEGLLL
jgi:hypothetical protein